MNNLGIQGSLTPGSTEITNKELDLYRSYVATLGNPNAKDESKLQAAQALSENFETILSSPQYPSFLEYAIKTFMKILQEGKVYYIAEYQVQSIRKLLLEMLYRMPTNKFIKPYVDLLLSLLFKLLQVENETNVIVCLRLIIELHKHFRPQYNDDIKEFLLFVKSIYIELPDRMNKIFEPKSSIVLPDLTENQINDVLSEICTITTVTVMRKNQDGSVLKGNYNLIPKAIYSLKVLQELPIIVVVMYGLYKENIRQEVDDYIPIIIKTITLQPLKQHRLHPSFNKEIFVDFMGAQIKTLSLLAYIIRTYEDVIEKYSQQMVEGMLGMLAISPPEVTHLRKELLIAARHILATKLKFIFIPYIDRLFDEDILLGRGWTTHESLRPLAYSTLADLMHHVRNHLTMQDLVRTVHLFAKKLHDETLPAAIQSIVCKLLNNLVECIKQQSEKDPKQAQIGQDLLMRLLEVFVLKFKTIAKLQLPALIAKSKQNEALKTMNNPAILANAPQNPPVTIKKEEGETGKFGLAFQVTGAYSVSDLRALCKTCVIGIKAIAWRFKNLKLQLKMKEVMLFIRLVKWFLQATDIYTITLTPAPGLGAGTPGQRAIPQQTVRTKEEKDVLEHFSGIFSVMDTQIFREIFSTTIDYMVERIAQNFALQIIGNSFLSNHNTSTVFATVLVEYLLGKMEEMGNGNIERSNLYLKLFKLVFGTVSIFAAENEHMLRPYLHQIVNRSMELAMTAKEPYNYFLLLRTLFRSIGGGNHDLLYQEFLPLLPNLLQGLNSLQSGLHKQHMKDLFVELCLTVPVRLSSLLPYLPMLMDPLVSALNGSHTLISQGLRTLELCVDNLQPDFLYEHIQPVRADLMQALWRSLRNPTDQVAPVAFRVLGKFGGGNRKMMIEPQKLNYVTTDAPGPCILIIFPEHPDLVCLPVGKIIENAVSVMKPGNVDIYYRRMAWGVLRDYILASMKFEDDRYTLLKFMHFHSHRLINISQPNQHYKCQDIQARNAQINALTGMFYSMIIKDLAYQVQPVFEAVIRHYTLISVAQQSGLFTSTREQNSLDPLVIVDALAIIMGHEEKELSKPGKMVLNLMLETASTILGTNDLACRLPIFEYVAERMCSLCYDRAWYNKLGGCLAIIYLFESMSIRWIYQHMYVFVKAQLFVMMDLTGEVSSGAIDQAKSNLEALVRLCAKSLDPDSNDPELLEIQTKALNDVSFELIRLVTSSTDLIREQSMHLLRVFAQVQNKSVVEVMERLKNVLPDMMFPKKLLHKHQSANTLLRHMSANTQIGLMEGSTFCTSLTPSLFKLNLSNPVHEVFFLEVMSLCETPDTALLKMSWYKNIGSLVPLRKAAMRALAACHYIPKHSDKIFNILYQLLDQPNPELQEAAFQCMKTFIAGTQVNMSLVHDVMRPLLSTLGDYRNLSLVGSRRLSYLVQLFPNSFNEKLCEQLLQHLQNLLETMHSQKGVTKNGDTEKIIVTIINIFHQIPAAGSKFIEPLAQLVLQTEKNLLIGASSPFRLPLIKFLISYPAQTVTFLLTQVKDEMWSRYLEYLIKQEEEGKPFRDVLQSNAGVEKIINLLGMATSNADDSLTQDEKYELQFQSIRITSLLVKYDKQWIANQHQLATSLTRLWCNDNYLDRHKNLESVSHAHWKEPKLLVKILLAYFTNHPKNIDLLFQIVRCFLKDRSLPSFQFVRDFLENTVAQNYTIEWKRAAFFRLVELFPLNPQPGTTVLSQELKSKVLQLIIIPCFLFCFERGEVQKLIGVPENHQNNSPENITFAFCYKMLDTEQPFSQGDAVRLILLQLACLFIDYTLPYLHDSRESQQGGVKLKKIMSFSLPALLNNNCVDPATKYHGHLVFCHIISKVNLDNPAFRKIIQQVLKNLLKAHAIEVRNVVRQALEILIPALPQNVPDGYNTLTQMTKRTLIEEGHSMQHLFHLIQLVTRHYSVYYPVRHHILQHMINALQKLGFSVSSSMEHKKLSCELGEVIVRWELQRIKDESQNSQESGEPGLKRQALDEGGQIRKKIQNPALGSSSSVQPIHFKVDPNELKPVEKNHVDLLINFIMRLACSVNEPNPTAAGLAGPGEILSRRCYNLVRTAVKPEVWPNYTIDFSLQWLEKLLLTVDTPEQNLGNVSMGLELFTLVLTVMKKEHILSTCKAINKGLNACISSFNNKIIRLTHALLVRLMSIFPIEPTSDISSKHEELKCIYSSVGTVAYEGIANYEKNPDANASSLLGTIMMLKAACSSTPSYVDQIVLPFVRVIHRMSREHLASSADATTGTSDLLIYSLDLLKNRIGAMNNDTKKTFIGSILVNLIEKTPDIKVMKAICKMVEDWVKNSKPLTGPNLKEKSILLVKLMQYVEKRFPDLNTQFLELVNFVYRDDAFKATELIPKLESAFLAGLRCTNPQIRQKFFEIFDASMRRRLHDRLMYIVSSQNWEPMGHHYWIKQCLELILVTADENFFLKLSPDTPLLESVRSVIENSKPEDRQNYIEFPEFKKEPEDSVSGYEVLQSYVAQYNSLGDIRNSNQVNSFLVCVTQLCHNDIPLAERVWIDLFPRLWAILSERQRTSLSGEMLPFIVSGSHVSQKDIHPSAISSFYEGMSLCNPPILVKPQVMAYIGKSHNLWHRVTLTLEKLVAEQSCPAAQAKIKRELDCYDFEPDVNPQQSSTEQLCEMYSQLKEEDLWCALWQKHARYKETCIALAYEQQGFFEQALGAWELALGKGRHDFTSSPAPFSMLQEERLWEKQWIRCTKELNQWDHLLDYAKTKNNVNPYLVLESAWRVPDWKLMKEAVSAVETCCPKELNWKVHLYHGFLAICQPEEQELPTVKRYVELASSLCMREWRRLPHIVSHIHLPYLQAAQQIMELHEACQIRQGLLHERTNSLHDMKAIVKTWRNRLPIISDDLSHWSDVFTWRQHHYQFITSHYDPQQDQGTTHSTFGVHASAQAIIHFGKIGRKHNLTGVCLDSLSRIYTIPFVPIVDCFQKIRQQVKCYVQMAQVTGSKELQEGLEVVESTNIKYFSNEMTSEFYALKGMLFAQIGRHEEANKAFSAAVQFHDTLVKAWALWGDYIESQFTKSHPPDIEAGINAIVCFLHACRHQNESKSRKYLAKVLWLLTYDDAKFSLTEAVEKYVVGVPPIQWLPWIPQLLTGLRRSEGKFLINLLSLVGRMFPQAVYFPIRTLYLTLKVEQYEKIRSQGAQAKSSEQLMGGQGESGGPRTLQATSSMWRCSRIIQVQREINPSVISSLEGFGDQIYSFRESWHEEVLKHLRQGLAKCYVTAFESRGAVSEATITPHTLQFIEKLMSNFGLDKRKTENISSTVATSGPVNASVATAAETIQKRAKDTIEDPVFHKIKGQFTADFDFNIPGAMKLQNLISKLKKWITILEAETKLLPKSFLIEGKSGFLSNFSLQTAEIELPGEFLLPKHSHYYVRISRFMPRVEIVQKHNTAARRLFIRGHNGKIYPYLVVNDSGLGDARREERVLQLLRMLNHYLSKQKETSRRFLHMTVPRVVSVSTLRLVEDNPASVSLLDVYKSSCQMLNIEHDAPVSKYYEKLASVQYRGIQASHQTLKDILKEVQTTMIPKSLLKDWALRTYPSPTDFWTFRKMFTLQMSLACFCEYVLHLTRLNPDMLYIHQDSGMLNISYFKFDVDDAEGELEANRAVPFRLTPNIQELISEIGVAGPFTASMIAAARCFVYPNFKVSSILRAILRDEMIFAHKEKQDEQHQVNIGSPPVDVAGELIINMVNHSVNSISQRLNSLSNFEGTESKVGTLVTAAQSPDFLCIMDPAWHPWL